MKILVVDDDALSLRLLVALVERLGHQPVTAADGVVAWELLRTYQCRVVISDWNMPGLDGIELLQRIRALGGPSYTYFILLTARSEREDVSAAMEAGADDLLAKPVSRDDLAVRLRVAERIVSLQEQVASRNHQLSLANELMRKDLHAAAQVQASLLPESLPIVPELDMAWICSPCEQLGGDTLNLFRLDEQHLGFYVLDVSGHGVSSALLAVQISRLLTPLIAAGALLKRASVDPPGYRLTPPLQVVRELNELFPMSVATLQYFTIAYGFYHLPSHEVRFTSAGHPGPIIVRAAGSAEAPEVSGNPIGFFPTAEASFSEYSFRLGAGDRAYFFSDGVVETVDAQREILGVERLGAALVEGRGEPLSDSLRVAVVALEAWRGGAPPGDDITMLGFERRR